MKILVSCSPTPYRAQARYDCVSASAWLEEEGFSTERRHGNIDATVVEGLPDMCRRQHMKSSGKSYLELFFSFLKIFSRGFWAFIFLDRTALRGQEMEARGDDPQQRATGWNEGSRPKYPLSSEQAPLSPFSPNYALWLALLFVMGDVL